MELYLLKSRPRYFYVLSICSKTTSYKCVTLEIILSCQGDGGRTTEPSAAQKKMGCCPGNMVVVIFFFVVVVLVLWSRSVFAGVRRKVFLRGGNFLP